MGLHDLAGYAAIGFFGIVWLYVAARMVARGILRSMKEEKQRHE
jgi:hypothetical protein